jgi:hypothetical protein
MTSSWLEQFAFSGSGTCGPVFITGVSQVLVIRGVDDTSEPAAARANEINKY